MYPRGPVTARLIFALALFAAMCFPARSSAQVPDAAMKLTASEAKRTIEKLLLEVDRGNRNNSGMADYFRELEPLQNVQVTMTSFSYLDKGKKDSGFSYKAYSATRTFTYRDLKYVGVKKCASKFFCLSPQITADHTDPKLTWSTTEQAQRFADALNRLIYESSPEKALTAEKELADFPAVADAWHKAGSVLELPESVRRLNTLAESYLKEKDFDQAIKKYEEGVKLYPTWPAGHFNAALLMGELGLYSDAIRHMKEYLLLVPNAPDAKPAQDKISFWEDKMRAQ